MSNLCLLNLFYLETFDKSIIQGLQLFLCGSNYRDSTVTCNSIIIEISKKMIEKCRMSHRDELHERVQCEHN